MAKLKVRLNSAGVVALLQSDEVLGDLRDRAERMVATLPTDSGEEWEAKAYVGRDRAQAMVKTANAAAQRTTAEEGGVDLISSLGSGR